MLERAALGSLAAVLLVGCASVATRDSTQLELREPVGDPLLHRRIAEATDFAGRLWLRGVGGLLSIGHADGSRRVHFEDGVVDLERGAKQLWVLRSGPSDHAEAQVSASDGTEFREIARFHLRRKEAPLLIEEIGDQLLILTSSRLRRMTPDGRTLSVTRLGEPLGHGVQVAAALPDPGKFLFVGFNLGEFGGGLWRIDLESGDVADVERKDSGSICVGPLDTDCSPVTGVIVDPRRPDCVLASIGLIHFMRNGRILRVCADEVSVELERPIDDESGWGDQSEPFFGLADGPGASYWAISDRAVYRLGGATVERFAIPDPPADAPIPIVRDVPGVVVLLTDVNWAVSVSGFTPLVIPLEGSSR